MKAKSYTVDIISALLVLLWIYAAISKLIPYQTSYTQLTISPYIRQYASVLVWLVPAIEIVLCILLIVPRWRKVGLAGSFILLTAFTIYIIAVLTFREHPPCSCGGIISKMSWTQHIFFNLFFMAITAIGYWLLINRKDNEEQDIVKVVQTGSSSELY